MATLCQERYETNNDSLRRVRYENVAVAVQVYYNILGSARYREVFADAFESVFDRNPKREKMLRDCFLLTYGKDRKSAAGTDAIALRGAVRDRVGAAAIPEYIDKNGGLERLRRGKRRDEGPKLIVRIDANRLACFDRMKVGHHLYAKIEKVCDSSGRKPTFMVVGVGSRLHR